MTRRQTFETSILALAAILCIFWLGAAGLTWFFRDFSLGPPDPQVVDEKNRFALAALAWFVVNAIGLVAYEFRRPYGRWLLAGVQCVNVAATSWAGFDAVGSSCGQSGFQWFAVTGPAALALSLEYLLWRRGDRVVARLSRAPISMIAFFAVGAALLGLSWHLGIDGIESHSGIVRTAQLESGALHVTLDTSSRDFVFNTDLVGPPPALRPGESVVILTGESCDYGTPKAVQGPSAGLWVAESYGDGEGVAPFSPDSWPTHELIRWLTLSLGVLLALVGAVKLFRWIG